LGTCSSEFSHRRRAWGQLFVGFDGHGTAWPLSSAEHSYGIGGFHSGYSTVWFVFFPAYLGGFSPNGMLAFAYFLKTHRR
jgi:hypothetical protein